MQLQESIYDLAFVAQIKDEIMSQYFDIVTGELIDQSEEEKDGLEGFNEQALFALNREVARPSRISSFARRRQTNAKFNSGLEDFAQALNAPVHRSVSQSDLVIESRKKSL